MTAVWVLLLAAPLRISAAPLFHRPPDIVQQAGGLYEKGEYGAVIRLLEPQVLTRLRSRRLASAYAYLGRSYEGTRRLDRALSTYQLAVGLFPKNTGLLIHLADLLHRTGLPDRAEPFYRKVLKLKARDPSAHAGLARILHSRGLLQEAEPHYNEALVEFVGEGRQDLSLLRGLGQLLAEERRFEEAIQVVQEATRLSQADPDSPVGGDPELGLDLAQFQHLAGLKEEGLATLRALRREHPQRADIVKVLALRLLSSGPGPGGPGTDAAEALAVLEGLLKIAPQDPLARFARGWARLKTSGPKAAAEDFLAAARSQDSPFTAQAAAKALQALE